MAFRTDLAVEAVENLPHAADLQQVKQTERAIEGFSVREVDILGEDAAREIVHLLLLAQTVNIS